MTIWQKRLYLGASVLTMTALTGWVNTASAQATPEAVEEIVVTGSSIRGVPPVGSSLVSVTAADIKATGVVSIQGILSNVPQLMGMGSAGEGASGRDAQQAIIHQFGRSASTSTLTLIDGHRLPLTGVNHSFADANILPINMVERVEVLATGASSIYGSDAVAGVVNFITRQRFDGIQVTGSAGLIDGKRNYSGSFLAGRNWDSGGAIFGYSHSEEGVLRNTARAYTSPASIRARGGVSNGNYNCSPATLQPAGSSVVYTSATSGQAVARTNENAPCDQWRYGSLNASTVRDSAMAKIRQEFGSDLTISSQLNISRKRVDQPVSRGTVEATVFRTGPQANPFWVTPVGYTGTANSTVVRWDANELLGPGAVSKASADSAYGSVEAEYRRGDWTFNLLALAGRDDSGSGSTGTLNGPVANLALNGTTNGGGSLTTVVPNTQIIVNQLPLTANTALDVWNPAASNRTSAAVRQMLTDSVDDIHVVGQIQQLRLQTQGDLIELPAGPLKVAFGGEILRTQIFESLAADQGSGPGSSAATYRTWYFDRDVESLYAEAAVPVVSADGGVPLVYQLDMNISGRWDRYSDFGVTKNWKVGLDWMVTPDLKLFGNASTSFVAPPIDEMGADGTWLATTYRASTSNINVPLSLFPLVAQMGIPGCTSASVTCNIGTLRGTTATRGDINQKASEGKGWSVGVDYRPSFVPRLNAQATYWSQKVEGASTGPNINAISTNGSLAQLLTFYPSCATAAEVEALAYNLPVTSALPPCTQYIVNNLNSNWLNMHAAGVDASINYSMPTDSYGSFTFGHNVSWATTFDLSLGTGGAKYSVLNTTGANSFPSVALQMRSNLGWTYGSFRTAMFVNYTGKYRNWGQPVNPVVLDPANNTPQGGGDWVKGQATADLNMSYRFETGMLENQELQLNIRNLFDQKPPFYNGGTGFNALTSNALGRVVTVGFTATF